ncbi:MAG: VWA domain-containing protein [Pyrinomonadaceae bacterium]
MKVSAVNHFLLFAVVFLAGTASLIAQTATPTPPPDDEGGVIKVESRLVVVPVSVTNAAGEPVLGLKAADFKVLEENRSQVVESVADAEKVPLEIALLFDVSASTDAMFRFQQETAAKFLREVLRPEDRATIFSVGQKPVLIQARDTAEKSIISTMSISPTKGATAFFDSIRTAADFLKINSPQGRRRVILVISDGEDNFSEGVQRAQRNFERNIVDNKPDPEFKRLNSLILQAQQAAKMSERTKVLKALQDADIVHYSINPGGSSYLLNRMSTFGQENMQTFSEATGGTAFLPKFQPIDTKDQLQNSSNIKRNTAVLVQIFRQLANEIRAQYLVQYYSETEFPQNKYVKLDVGLQNPASLKIRARQGYYVKN